MVRNCFTGPRNRSMATAWLLGLLLLVLPISSWAEDYTLDTGDALRIAVFGEAAYPLDVVVDDRGMISLPLLGEVRASGFTPAQLSAEIQLKFTEEKLLVEPFVQVDIREYRPFFIAGAVSNPGSYPYRPGITVRHALAIAGGFKALPMGDTTPALRIADLRGERAKLLIEEFRYRVRLERLRAESRNQGAFLQPADARKEVSPDLARAIVAAEHQQVQVRRAAFRSELAYLKASLARARKDAANLAIARDERENAANFQLKELETARGLREKGLVTNSNLLTAERTQNSYRVDLAQAEVQQARVQQEILNLESQYRKKHEDRELELLAELQSVQLEIGKIQTSLRSVTDKLLFVSHYGEHKTFDDLRDSVRVTVYRGRGDSPEAIVASETTKVLAGDVVEVSVMASQQFYIPGPAAASPPAAEERISVHPGVAPIPTAAPNPLAAPVEKPKTSEGQALIAAAPALSDGARVPAALNSGGETLVKLHQSPDAAETSQSEDTRTALSESQTDSEAVSAPRLQTRGHAVQPTAGAVAPLPAAQIANEKLARVVRIANRLVPVPRPKPKIQ